MLVHAHHNYYDVGISFIVYYEWYACRLGYKRIWTLKTIIRLLVLIQDENPHKNCSSSPALSFPLCVEMALQVNAESQRSGASNVEAVVGEPRRIFQSQSPNNDGVALQVEVGHWSTMILAEWRYEIRGRSLVRSYRRYQMGLPALLRPMVFVGRKKLQDRTTEPYTTTTTHDCRRAIDRLNCELDFWSPELRNLTFVEKWMYATWYLLKSQVAQVVFPCQLAQLSQLTVSTLGIR